VALRYWGVDEGPNFEGKNILWVPREPAEVATDVIAKARKILYEARARRIHPGRDDKVLAAWNGLACRAFAESGRALNRPDYTRAAVRNLQFVLSAMKKDGRLLRSWKDGEAKLLGYLEDYATAADACLAVYEAAFDRRWLAEARGLADEMIRLFWDEEPGGFFDTGGDHEPLVVRPRNLYDNAVPCGSSVAVEALFRLAILTGEERYEKHGLRALRPMAELMSRHPAGFGRFLCALDFHLGPVSEVALVWPPARDGLESLLDRVFGCYLPNRVVVGCADGEAAARAGIPLLEARPVVGGRATAYVCQRYVCKAPTTDPEDLARQLGAEGQVS
jgi:uncharacterized protein YyaL (SSP411 family)